jgi:hypothetical protein
MAVLVVIGNGRKPIFSVFHKNNSIEVLIFTKTFDDSSHFHSHTFGFLI